LRTWSLLTAPQIGSLKIRTPGACAGQIRVAKIHLANVGKVEPGIPMQRPVEADSLTTMTLTYKIAARALQAIIRTTVFRRRLFLTAAGSGF